MFGRSIVICVIGICLALSVSQASALPPCGELLKEFRENLENWSVAELIATHGVGHKRCETTDETHFCIQCEDREGQKWIWFTEVGKAPKKRLRLVGIGCKCIQVAPTQARQTRQSSPLAQLAPRSADNNTTATAARAAAWPPVRVTSTNGGDYARMNDLHAVFQHGKMYKFSVHDCVNYLSQQCGVHYYETAARGGDYMSSITYLMSDKQGRFTVYYDSAGRIQRWISD